MKLLFSIILLVIVIFLSTADETSIRITTAQGKVRDIIIPMETQEFTIAPFHIDVVRIDGLENLPNLKKLYLGRIYTLEDFSFLRSLVSLEILIIESCDMKNTDFLRDMTNLKLLFLYGVSIYNNKLSLSQDMRLEVLYLRGMNSWPPNRHFVLAIEDLPSSLKYIDLDLNIFLRMTDEFLDSISSVPTIIMDRDDYRQNPNYFQSHRNFIFSSSEELLPDKYRSKSLRAKTEYGFYG